MRRNYSMRRLEQRHRKGKELLLVPLIDIFIVLVTFLLMTAVFSRTVILELKLPTQDAPFVEPPPGLKLEVLLRQDMVQVADRVTGPLATFPRADRSAAYDLAQLSEYLQQVKARFSKAGYLTVRLPQTITPQVYAPQDLGTITLHRAS